MAVTLNINGTDYFYPETGEVQWGSEATDWASAVTTGMLQKAGGLFQLLADVDFGTTYGIKSLYYKTRTANIADAGQFRLARADVISWRNQANGANLDLGVNASDILTFNGTALQNVLSVSDTATINLTLAADVLSAEVIDDSITNAKINSAAAIAYSKLNLSGAIVNADISNAAAIAYSKLNLAASIVNADIANAAAIAYSKLALTDSIVNADINSAAAIAYSKLALTNSIVNADIAGAAAIAYSKLALTNSIVNADIAAGAAIVYSKLSLANSIVNADIAAAAAIAHSKMAALTASRALVSDGSGFASASAVTATELGYLSGVTSALQTQLDGKTDESTLTTKGDLYVATGAGVITRLAAGANGDVLTANSGTATGLEWAVGGGGGGGLTWSVITADQTAAVDNGYITDSATRLNVTLPNATAGKVVSVAGLGAGGWKITPGSGQNIVKSGEFNTDAAIMSVNQYAAIQLLCTVTNTTWEVISFVGSASSLNAGYAIGGNTGSDITSIQRILFDTEAISTLASTIATATNLAAGVSGPLKGYSMGGYQGGSRVASIYALTFGTQLAATLGATLDGNRADATGVSNATNSKGFVIAGTQPTTLQSIEDMVFASDVSALISSTIAASRQSANRGGMSSTIKGYLAGGYDSGSTRQATIYGLVYATEVTGTLAATLSQATVQSAGNMNSSTKGYIAGGETTVKVTTWEALTFSGESRGVLAATLNTATKNATGVTGISKAFCMGGVDTGVRTAIEDLDLNTETSSLIGSVLNIGSYGSAGVQG